MRRERLLDRGAELRGVPGAREEVEVEGGVELVGPEVLREPIDVREPDLADEGRASRGTSRRSRATSGTRRGARRGRCSGAGRGPGRRGSPGAPGPSRGVPRSRSGRPATPRSNQKRRMSSNSCRTSGWSQLRSGCSGVKRWRYHSSGRPSRPVARVQLSPPKLFGQCVGGCAPSGPLPCRNQNRSRSADPGAAASAAWNHGCRSEMWFGTTSTIVPMPSSSASLMSALGILKRAERRVDPAVVLDVVAAVGERRGVPRREPERVDAERLEVGQAGAHAGEVADAVTVRVGEAPRVDLVDDGAAPPRRILLRRLHALSFALVAASSPRRSLRGRRCPRQSERS